MMREGVPIGEGSNPMNERGEVAKPPNGKSLGKSPEGSDIAGDAPGKYGLGGSVDNSLDDTQSSESPLSIGKQPSVEETMARWDNMTGRSSRTNTVGPQSPEARRKVSRALNRGVGDSVIRIPEGQPKPLALRRKTGAALRESHRKRKNNSDGSKKLMPEAPRSHPDVEATIRRLDKITGGSGRQRSIGPLSDETRERISESLSETLRERDSFGSLDGQQGTPLRRKIGDARRASHQNRRNNS